MNSTAAAAFPRPVVGFDVQSAPQAAFSAATRRVVLTTSGHRHGPITRLVSPSDIGELIKPFVFLESIRIPASRR